MNGSKDILAAKERRKCYGCKHLENLDYIHGCGECAALEGETVIQTRECICPEEILRDVEIGLQRKIDSL